MDSSQYFTLELKSVTTDQEDLLVAELFEMGAAGVQENLKFQQTDRRYLAEVVEQDCKDLIIYFETTPSPEQLDQFVKTHPNLTITLNEHPIVDWLSEWKKQWKAFALVEEVWVVPPWQKESFDSRGKKALLIEPGMAFGTGTHETTQIAAQLLFETLHKSPVTSVLDVGTGSGILAILAAFRGVKNIYAYDNDSESQRVFNENCEQNNVAGLHWVPEWSTDLAGKVELTIANIIDGVLIDLKEDFRKINSKTYIFTGILLEREEAFLKDMFSDWPVKVSARVQKGEWVGFCVEATR